MKVPPLGGVIIYLSYNKQKILIGTFNEIMKNAVVIDCYLFVCSLFFFFNSYILV